MESVRNRPPDDVPIFQSLCCSYMWTSVVEEYADGDLKSRISETVFRIHKKGRGYSSNEKGYKVMLFDLEHTVVSRQLAVYASNKL